MRLLVVNFEFPPVGGGGANATRYLTKELVKRGHAVDVLTSHFRGLPRHEVVDGVQIWRVPVVRRRLDFCSVKEMMTFAVSAVPYALWLTSRRQYDLVHVFFAVPCGHIGWLLKRTHSLPYVISARGGDVPGFKPYGYKQHYRRIAPFVRYLWNDAHALAAVSQGLKEMMIRVSPDIKKIIVIPNGVDIEEFHPTSPKATRDRPLFISPVRILTVTRLISRKGLDYLIEAAALLRERTRVPYHIDIVGEGVYRPQLEQHVREAHVQDLVTFHGARGHDELALLYQQADIFCLPSLAEGMSNVLLEALASGLPLVATNVGGSLELVRPQVNGLLVNQADAADLTEKLLGLIESPAQRVEFGRASRERAEQFSWSAVAERYEEVYEKVARGKTVATKAQA